MGRTDKKLDKKKLGLKRETLRKLDDGQLGAVAGGAPKRSFPPPTGTCGCGPE